MAVISTLAVNIIAKTAGFTRGVRSTRRSMQTFNNTVRNTKRLLMGLIAGTGIIRGFRALIRVASEAQETMAKFNTVFRDLGDAKGTVEWANKFAKAVGRSKQDIKSYLAELQDIFVPLGFGRDEAAKFAKSITQLGVDVASFNEKVDRDVMRNFTSALMGSHRAVRQYGVAISESRIQMESYNTGLNKSFAHLTDMEKIYLRYVIILNDTRDAQGDATRTQDDFANQLKRTRGVIKDLAQQIGDKLLPHLVGVLKVVRGVIDRFSEMDVAALSVSASNIRLVVSIGVFLFILPKIVAAIRGVIVAFKALAQAQAITQAFGGPAGWAALVAGATIAAAAVVALNVQFNKLADTVSKLSKEKGEFKSIGEQIRVTMGDIEQSLTKGRGGKIEAPVFKTIQSLRKELNKLTLSADGMARFDLEEELGMSRFNVRAKGLFEALDIMLRIRGLLEAKAVGKSIFEEMLTPMEKFNKRLRELSHLLRVGAISQETFDRATHQAKLDRLGTGANKGQFDVVRKSLVSITGLAAAQDPALGKMDQQILEAKKANTTLQNIDRLIESQREVLRDIPLTVTDLGAKQIPKMKPAAEEIRKQLTPQQRLARLEFVARENRFSGLSIFKEVAKEAIADSLKHAGRGAKTVLSWGTESRFNPYNVAGAVSNRIDEQRERLGEAVRGGAERLTGLAVTPSGIDMRALIAETKRSNELLESIAAKEGLN